MRWRTSRPVIERPLEERIAPGGTVGILGGGQLGRMLAGAAARLGLKAAIYDPDPGAPARDVAAWDRIGAWDDAAALRSFAAAVDVVTYEFENVALSAVDTVADIAPVRPGRRALEVSQDRLTEKSFLRELGLATAPFVDVPTPSALQGAVEEIGLPGILKTRRFGYDGKGQVRVTAANPCSEISAPAIYEGHVAFEREISVIAARGLDGAVACYDPGENVHEGGILRTTTVPAALPGASQQEAILAAGRILNALDYVGVLGVEIFWAPTAPGGPLVINEIAPRVHNSGHWTSAGCLIDQFEQHIRAICGWPLGDGARHSDAVMTNLLGDEILTASDLDGALEIYGKAEPRPGRKMGHVTRLSPKR
ncbi:MAG: 5-(carboxyamino)imidazole ribonucleotide synthase [Pseudomonadota bacterium]